MISNVVPVALSGNEDRVGVATTTNLRPVVALLLMLTVAVSEVPLAATERFVTVMVVSTVPSVLKKRSELAPVKFVPVSVKLMVAPRATLLGVTAVIVGSNTAIEMPGLYAETFLVGAPATGTLTVTPGL